MHTNRTATLGLRGKLTFGSLSAVLLGMLSVPAGADTLFNQTNLVTDDQAALAAEGLAPALHVDANLKNPWGISRGPGSPFWVSNQVTGTSTLYNGVGAPFPVGTPLVVSTPQNASGPAGPTGQVFNSTTSFSLPTGGKGLFFFANLDGSISGWNGAQGTSAFKVVPSSTSMRPAIYTGITIGSNAGNSFIYAANGATGKIDVFDTNFQAATLTGSFTDPNAPAGLQPFNVQNLNGTLYVTYAIPGPQADDAPLGSGVVNAFSTDGTFIGRVTTGGPLASPWGLALAPGNLGDFSNALLVGNFNDENGNINAFNPTTGSFLGTLKDANGNAISLPDLWGLEFGDGGMNNGKVNQLFFAAGIGDEQHGVFGSLSVVPEPDSVVLLVAGLLGVGIWAPLRNRRRRDQRVAD